MKAPYSTLSYCLVLCFSILLHPVLQAQPDQPDRAIREALAQQHLTGAVWAVVEPDGSITTGSAGIKNNDTKAVLKATDKVHVGSVAKMILAAGVLHLATAGKLNLDDPVAKYLPAVKFKNNWEVTDPVTIRHLLDHTSGLSDLRLWHLFSTTASPDAPLARFIDRDPALLTLQNRPGAIFSYSNMGYTLLGMVLEAVTGQRYEHYLDEHLLKPLGMHNSTFRFMTQTADTALAMGHLDDGKPVAALPVYVRPATQINTTAYDMGIFLRFMMGDGSLNGKEFIASKYLSQLGRPLQTNAAKNGLPYGYSLGASYRDMHGVLGIVHAGNIVGYWAMAYMFPEKQQAYFISVNTDSESANYEVFNEILIRHLKVAGPVQRRKITQVEGLQEWDGYYVRASTKLVPFRLLDHISGFTRVQVQAKGALLRPAQSDDLCLDYLGNHIFIAEGKVAPSHVFYKDTGGQLYVTNGLSTIKKVNGWGILLGLISFVTGLAGMLFLLLSGIYQVVKFRGKRWQQPLVLYLLSLLIILIGVAFMLTKSFVAIGDLNAGTLLLSMGTGLLPVGILLAIYRSRKSVRSRLLSRLDLLFMILVLQFLVLLLVNEILPVMLWR